LALKSWLGFEFYITQLLTYLLRPLCHALLQIRKSVENEPYVGSHGISRYEFSMMFARERFGWRVYQGL
jgi:hypothetical protein